MTEQQRVLVVGGYGGLGAVISRQFAEQGAAVAIAGRSLDKATELAEKVAADGGIALPVAVDITDSANIAAAVKLIDGEWGGIDVLVNSASKLITLLLYMNPAWEAKAGRLRLLRSADNLDDCVAEIAPLAGTMVAFRLSDASFHGHQPHRGERRVLQLNWVTDAGVLRRELGRHGWSARLKALNPFG